MPKKKQSLYINRNIFIPIGVAAVLAILFLSWALIDSKPPKQKPDPLPRHIMPYVDGQAAADQVNNFYRQYINPRTPSKKMLVEGYGNKNLEFYYDYYQHGFDPIVCSTSMPVAVTTSLESTGPVAKVNVLAEYPDGTKGNIVATVVLNEGMDIDAIMCPGDKGNLPPN